MCTDVVNDLHFRNSTLRVWDEIDRLPKFNISPEKRVVGRWSFPIGIRWLFRGELLNFGREFGVFCDRSSSGFSSRVYVPSLRPRNPRSERLVSRFRSSSEEFRLLRMRLDWWFPARKPPGMYKILKNPVHCGINYWISSINSISSKRGLILNLEANPYLGVFMTHVSV